MKIRVLHDADLRVERGEGIGRNFRPGVRNGREQSGFAGVWISDQADIRHDAQFEEKIAFFARLAGLREARRLPGSGGKIAVAQVRRGRPCTGQTLSVLGQIGDQFAFRRWRPRRNAGSILAPKDQFPSRRQRCGHGGSADAGWC